MRVPIEVATMKIADLNLSTRAFNCLSRAGIKTLEDLFDEYNAVEDLMQIRNLGISAANEIVTKVQTVCPRYTTEKIEVENEQTEELFINRLKSIIISLGLICGEIKEAYETVFTDLQDLIVEASNVRKYKNMLLKAQEENLEKDGTIEALRRHTSKLENRITEQHALIERLKNEKDALIERLRAEKDRYKNQQIQERKVDDTDVNPISQNDEPADDDNAVAYKFESKLWFIPLIIIVFSAVIAFIKFLAER